MKNVFTEHPHSVHETYWQHFGFAACCALRMIAAGCACITHAIFPFVFTRTASTMIYKLAEDMAARNKIVKEQIDK